MSIVPTVDHRTSDEDGLLAAVQQGEALAFAEVCTRTLPAAHAVARRLVPRGATETVLREVYGRLWEAPPRGVVLERWVRQSCFEVARALLRSRGWAPATASAQSLLADLPPAAPAFVDGTEQALATLDGLARCALVRAHDAGLRADDLAVAAAATRGLLDLAGASTTVPPGAERGAEHTFGLLDPEQAAEVLAAIESHRGELGRSLRRGRRRLEGLGPGSDLVARVVASTLSTAALLPVEGNAPLAGPARPTTACGPPALPAAAVPTREQPSVAANGVSHRQDPDDGAGEPATAGASRPRPSRRTRVLLGLGWLVVVTAAVGLGMLLGRLLLRLGFL